MIFQESPESERRILVAEDDPLSRMWLQTVLESWQYEVVAVTNGDEAIHMMDGDDAPQLVLLDWLMPGMDGIDVCRRLKSDPQGRFCYILMLTSRSGTADIVEALNAGADDFISKPFEPEELRVRLRVGERILRLQQELLRRASHDDLTGLFSRRTLMEAAQREVELAQRNGTALSVVLIDMDHFKAINDSYGHQAGDAVLRECANRLRQELRSTDIIGRYGGEEMMALLPGSDLPAARNVAENLRNALAQPVYYEGQWIPVSASLGVSALSSQPNQLTTCIQKADDAMYRAKAAGRNRVEVNF